MFSSVTYEFKKPYTLISAESRVIQKSRLQCIDLASDIGGTLSCGAKGVPSGTGLSAFRSAPDRTTWPGIDETLSAGPVVTLIGKQEEVTLRPRISRSAISRSLDIAKRRRV
jgi:hypothetical protein